MTAIINYNLSPAGQKASILSGGNGQREQSLTVEPTDPHFAAVVDLAKIDAKGVCELDARTTDYSYPEAWRQLQFDAIPTVETVLERVAAREAAKKDAADAEAAELHAKTLAVLNARKTTSRTTNVRHEENGSTGYAECDCVAPDWPYTADKSVIESPEAKAWRAELDAINVEAELSAKAVARSNWECVVAEKVAAQKKADEAAAKKSAWREANGLEADDVSLRVDDGCLSTVPSGCWESHSRGKNWLATITSNPRSPGGLDREFAEKCKGGSYYVVPSWNPGDAVEFGADYYSGSGRKNAKRWYGFYVRTFASIGETPAGHAEGTVYVVLREIAGGKTAIKAGEKWAKDHPPEPVRTNAEGGIVRAVDTAIDRLNERSTN